MERRYAKRLRNTKSTKFFAEEESDHNRKNITEKNNEHRRTMKKKKEEENRQVEVKRRFIFIHTSGKNTKK